MSKLLHSQHSCAAPVLLGSSVQARALRPEPELLAAGHTLAHSALKDMGLMTAAAGHTAA